MNFQQLLAWFRHAVGSRQPDDVALGIETRHQSVRWTDTRQATTDRNRTRRGVSAHQFGTAKGIAMRNREVAHLLVTVREWGERRPDVAGIALTGSWSHGAPTMNSDVNLLILCDAPRRYLEHDEWVEELGEVRYVESREIGNVLELRFRTISGLEVGLGFTDTSWATGRPVDETTARAVEEGISLIHDPQRVISRLVVDASRLTSGR